MIKAVIFDLDNTLYDYDTNHRAAMAKLAVIGGKMFGLSENEFIRCYENAKTEVKKCKRGTAAEHNRLFYAQKTAELLGKSPIPAALTLYNAYWDAFLENMQPYDGVIDFLQALKNAGIKTAICTDMTSHIQYRKLLRLQMEDMFDAIVSSEETGVEKPHPLMFQILLDKLGAQTTETIYIGDSRERDVAGALNSGLTAVWFVHRRPYEPDDELNICADYNDPGLRRICGLA